MIVRRSLALVLLSALVTCASSLTVRVDLAPEFVAKRGAKISVLGVFHDGRLSEPAWGQLSPKVSGALGHEACEVGYSQALREAKPELAASIEHDVRENGIDDTVLERVGPSASGELIMVLLSYRQIPAPRDGGAVRASAARPPPIQNGRAMRSAPMSRDGPPPDGDHLFELSASLFSVALHKLVAQIDLRYAGDDLDEAMDAFAKKLRLLLPDATCAGWTW